ncbi:MAG: hypothetical protein GTO14_15710 [Anaerolineales bacterium]|nr:hypothetical protein [Anaerolineales bacterium]
MTVFYSDQCPYTPDTVQFALMVFKERGISTQTVKFGSSEQLRAESPSAYGVFGIVYNGSLFSSHYLGKKEIRRLDEDLLA